MGDLKMVKVHKGQLPKRVYLPRSKSVANRLLILGALTPGPFTIHSLPRAQDVRDLVLALKQLGLKIEENEKSLTIFNSFPECESAHFSPQKIQVGEGGTTARFLLSLLAKGRKKYLVEASGRLPQRPMEPLLATLKSLGVKVEIKGREAFPVEIEGPIQLNTELQNIVVKSDLSSQFASSLLMALVDHPTIEVRPEGLEHSGPYFTLTQALVNEVKSGQREFTVPYDMSALPPLVSLSLLLGDLVLPDLEKLDFRQADTEFFSFVSAMGGRFEFLPHGLQIYRALELKAGEFDCRQCPDLVPSLALLCSYAKGHSLIKGIKNLQIKESNRLEEISRLLTLFEISHEYLADQDTLKIKGKTPNVNHELEVFPAADHRMVILAHNFLCLNGGGVLLNPEPVAKSWPEYFQQFIS